MDCLLLGYENVVKGKSSVLWFHFTETWYDVVFHTSHKWGKRLASYLHVITHFFSPKFKMDIFSQTSDDAGPFNLILFLVCIHRMVSAYEISWIFHKKLKIKIDWNFFTTPVSADHFTKMLAQFSKFLIKSIKMIKITWNLVW